MLGESVLMGEEQEGQGAARFVSRETNPELAAEFAEEARAADLLTWETRRCGPSRRTGSRAILPRRSPPSLASRRGPLTASWS